MNLTIAGKLPGMTDYSELDQLALWASKSKNIIEIGSWKGRSTRAICDNTDGNVFAIDHWEGPLRISSYAEYGNWLKKEGKVNVRGEFVENLKDHLMSHKLFMVEMSSSNGLKYLLEKYGANYFDMIFIDGGHEYEVVVEDIILSKLLIKPGGILCGHDAGYNEILKAVREKVPGFKTCSMSLWYKEV